MAGVVDLELVRDEISCDGIGGLPTILSLVRMVELGVGGFVAECNCCCCCLVLLSTNNDFGVEYKDTDCC